MDYILTTKSVNYPSCTTVSSIKEIERITKKTILIVESYTDRDFDFLVFLLNAMRDNSLTNVAYISESPSRIVLETMKTVGAHVIQDSSLIDNTESFSYLLEYMTTKKEEVSSDTLTQLSDSFALVDEYVRNKVSEEPKLVARKISLAYDMLSSVLQDVVFSDVLNEELQSFLLTASSRIKVAEDDLEKKEQEVQELRGANNNGFGSISAYTQYNYTGNSKVLIIKEESPTRYLTSFLIGYLDWLQKVPEYKAKLIIIENETEYVHARYRSLKRVDSQSITREASTLYLLSEMYTTTPTVTVMNSLMAPAIDLYIVLDRTYKKTQIVSGRGINTIYSVSSRRLMRELGLTSEQVIVNDLGEQTQLGVLAQIEQYALDKESRKIQQRSAFEPIMRKLTEICNLDYQI